MPVFLDDAKRMPVAEHLADHAINLPSGHNLTEEQVDYVATQIRDILGA